MKKKKKKKKNELNAIARYPPSLLDTTVSMYFPVTIFLRGVSPNFYLFKNYSNLAIEKLIEQLLRSYYSRITLEISYVRAHSHKGKFQSIIVPHRCVLLLYTI